MLVAALILSICSIALPAILCVALPIVIQVIGLILGIISIILAVQGKKKEPEKKGMATASLVLGIIGTVLSGILLVVAILAVGVVATGFGALNNALNSKEVQDALNALTSPSPSPAQ